MEATQEEMRRLSSEMEGQLKAIDATMATIEFDLKGNIVSANENFLKLMKYSLEEIKGKHHSIFVDKGERTSQSYKEFWTSLSLGKSFDGEFKRINKGGEEVYIKGIYNPVFNAKGEPTKVLKLAYNITEQKTLFNQNQEQLSQVQAQEEELRQSMEEMQATQEEMRRLSGEMEGQLKAIDATMAAIEFDLNGNILTANENFLKLMKYTLEEIKGKHHSIFVESIERKSEAYKEFWASLSSGKSSDGEFKRITKGGQEVYIKGIYNPVFDSKGEPIKVLKLAYDITEQKTLFKQNQEQLSQVQAQEEELRQSMEEMQATQEEVRRLSTEMEGQIKAINSTVATIEFDLQGNILTANENFLELMKYSLNEIKDKHHSIFVESKEKKSEGYKEFWASLSSGKSFDGEFKRIAKGGQEVYIKGIYNPVFDAKGEPVKVLKLAYDITEQKSLFIQNQEQLSQVQAQEEELRQSMEEMAATQEEMRRLSSEMEGQIKAINSTMATIEFDLQGNILTANENFLNLMGYRIEDIQSKHHRIFVANEEIDSREYLEFWKKLSNGISENGEFRRITKSGKEVYINGIYNPIFNAKGEPAKVLKLAYDITNQKLLFAETRQQLEMVQAQEETLRMSTEELEATQEEMKRLSSEMESKIKAIDSTVATIEFDLSGNILTANGNFLKLFGYQLEDVAGKHHKIFVDKKETNSEAYLAFWKNLSEGKSCEGEFKRVTKGGKEVFIKGIYNPVINSAGVPVKIFKLAYDVTDKKMLEKELRTK
jgi:PAS domain S-box-containing protein